MEVVEAPLGLLLHSALQCSPGISFFFFSYTFSLFLLHTHTHKRAHVSILAYVFIMHIHFILMVTQGTSSRRHPALLTITHKNCGRDPIYSISPLFIHPVPLCSPCVLFMWTNSEHIAYSHSCSSNLSSRTLIITLFSAEIPLLVSSPFCYQTHHLLTEQSSVFRDNVLVTFLL